jgi:SNF2 family DNA or RNA helicase
MQNLLSSASTVVDPTALLSSQLDSLLAHLRTSDNSTLPPEIRQKVGQLQDLLVSNSSAKAPQANTPAPGEKPKKRLAPTIVSNVSKNVIRNPDFDFPDEEDDIDAASVASEESALSFDFEHSWYPGQKPPPGTAQSAYYEYRQTISVQKARFRAEDEAKSTGEEDDVVDFDALGDSEFEVSDDESDEGEDAEPARENLQEESARVVEEYLRDLEARWQAKRRPLVEAKASKLWHTYRTPFDRYKAGETANADVRHLTKRLKANKAGLLEVRRNEDQNINIEVLKRRCGVLDETFYDLQDARFNANILAGVEPPAKVKTRRVRKVKKTEDFNEEGGIDITSDYEIVESDDDFIDIDEDSQPSFPETIDLPIIASDAISSSSQLPEISSPVKAKEDPKGTPRTPTKITVGSQKSPIVVIDLTGPDSERELEQDAIPAADPEPMDLSETTVAEDDMPDIAVTAARLTPHKKRKRVVRESQVSKKLHQDTQRRVQESSQRASENLRQLETDSSFTAGERHVINIGKAEDENFIYISPKASRHIKPHQLEGLQFLWRETVTPRNPSDSGCLLSHTMGLGKTFQAITLLATIEQASRDPALSSQIPRDLQHSKTLVLCPPALVGNWNAEFEKWLPTPNLLGRIWTVKADLSVPARQRAIEYWNKERGVLIIGFRMFMQSCDTTEDTTIASILTDAANLVIVDEAHNLKNPSSKTTKRAKEIRTQRRIALTGTPLSNNLEEYWSMIDFVCPNYLGTQVQFRARFREPIEEGCYIDSSPSERKRAVAHMKALERRLEPKVHRRDASVLKDTLPSCQDYIIKVQLSPEQRVAYDHYVDLFKEAKGENITTASFFQYIYDTILLCNHPRILLESQLARLQNKDDKIDDEEVVRNENGGPNKDAGLRPEHIERLTPYLDIDILKGSHKIEVFLQIVRSAIEVQDKTLVFTHSIRTLDFLEAILRKEDIKYLRLDGSTKVVDRPDMINDFNHKHGPNVFIISTNAGGEGTNMHGANRVIIFDFRFNPSKEEQAIGRAYRLGQTKPVYVYRIITDGTSESHLLNLVGFKTQLAVKVIERKNASNVSSRKLKEGLHKAKTVPTIGNLDPTTMTSDIILSKILHAHNREPFMTNLETTEIYRKEEDIHLTAEDNQLIENLLQEEQTGIRHRPQAQPFYHGGTGGPSTTMESMIHAAGLMMGADLQGRQSKQSTVPQMPASGILAGGLRALHSGFNHARNMVNGGGVVSSSSPTPKPENDGIQTSQTLPTPPTTHQPLRPLTVQSTHSMRPPGLNGSPHQPINLYQNRMSNSSPVNHPRDRMGPTTNNPSNSLQNRRTTSEIARMRELGINPPSPPRSKNQPSLFRGPDSPGSLGANAREEMPRRSHNHLTSPNNQEARTPNPMSNSPIGDHHRITPAERNPKPRYEEGPENSGGHEREDPPGTCKPM